MFTHESDSVRGLFKF